MEGATHFIELNETMFLKTEIKSYTGRIYGKQGEEVKVIMATEHLSLVENAFLDRYYVTTDKLTDEFVAPKEAVPDTAATINNRASVANKKAMPINNNQQTLL